MEIFLEIIANILIFAMLFEIIVFLFYKIKNKILESELNEKKIENEELNKEFTLLKKRAFELTQETIHLKTEVSNYDSLCEEYTKLVEQRKKER